MEQGFRTRVVTALILAAVFTAGVLLGVAVDSNLRAQPAENVVEATEDGGSLNEHRRRQPVYRQVAPNETQLALIDSIVKAHRARTNALDDGLRAEYRSGFRVILLETREAIKSVLTPEQAAEYQRLLEEYDARDAAERDDGDEKD